MTIFSRLSALSAVAAAAVALLSPARAEAAGGDFDVQQNLIITGERLFGFAWGKAGYDGDANNTSTSFSLLTPNKSVAEPYVTPTFGIHYPIIPQLTLGAQFGIVHTSAESENGNGTTTDEGSSLGLLLAPRVGYILGINPGAYIWLRGGISYYRVSAGRDGLDTVESGVGFSLDPMFVVTPVNHFGITIGPTVDLPLSGSVDPDGQPSYDKSLTNIGLQFGLLGYL